MKITKDSLKELIKEELDLYTEDEEEHYQKKEIIKMYKDIKLDIYMNYVLKRDPNNPKKIMPRRGALGDRANELYFYIKDLEDEMG
jgi:hypothetical protein